MAHTKTARPAPSGGNRFFNRLVGGLLATPLGRLGGGLAMVRYKGRVSGQQRQLPVYLRPIEGGYLIRVGRAEQKNWWRNFRTAWPIEIAHHGRVIRGTGLAVSGETQQGRQMAADFFAANRSAARRAGLPRLKKGERQAPDAVAAAAAGMVFVVVTPKAA